MTRQEARRYVDVTILRRGTPTPDFSIHLDDDMWWRGWDPPDDEGREPKLTLSVVMMKLAMAGGRWESTHQAAADLGVADRTAKLFLNSLVERGTLAAYSGPRGAKGYQTLAKARDEHDQADGDAF